MKYMVSMDSYALKQLMDRSFDRDAYEQGRKDVQEKVLHQRDADIQRLKEDAITEVKSHLEGGSYTHTPGPSYWIGCLEELNFV